MVLTRRFWRTHVAFPGMGFALALSVVAGFDLDRTISHAIFFDSASKQWLGAAQGLWWGSRYNSHRRQFARAGRGGDRYSHTDLWDSHGSL